MIEAFWSTMSVLLAIFTARNFIVFYCRIKEINRISAVADKAIDAGMTWQHIQGLYDAFNEGASYEQQLFDLTKWTYKQFYPHD